MRIGIDVGGTFTDVVGIDDATGKIHYAKVPTAPKSPADGVFAGIEKILRIAGATMDAVAYIVHGTTIGTNALIERSGARTGLITTAGFRDVLEIGRVQRPAAGLYDFTVDNPPPLVPRELRVEVAERVGATGAVVTPLDEDDAVRAVAFLKDRGVEAIAVSLLFSFLYPDHEQRIAAIVRDRFPEADVCLSCEVAPEYREYERTSTTVINAYLTPITRRYIENLEVGLSKRWGDVDLRIMQASGGCMTAATAKARAIQMVNSGPAGGAVAGSFIGSSAGEDRLVTVDMGGTSFDIARVTGGAPTVTADGKFQGLPVKIPMIDINAIGAGGGSIAWVDAGGALNVGPVSAGSEPGPVCYGRGGMRPTVTDANLVLGRLNADYFLGGEIRLDVERAREAIATEVAGPMNMEVEEAAWGILRLVNAHMVKGISVSSTERGYDVREYAMVAFGGAGPLHAAELAFDMGIRKVVIPPYAGNLSALGLLVSDTRHDFVCTVMKTARSMDAADLTARFTKLETRAGDQLQREGVDRAAVETQWSADLRYEGQSYELNTALHRRGLLTAEDVQRLADDFNDLHKKIYAYSSADEEIEIVNLRVVATGRSPEVMLAGRDGGTEPAASKETRTVYFSEEGIACSIYERDEIPVAARLPGPCLIEERISTTVVPPEADATIDPNGSIVIEWGGRAC